MSYLDIYRNRLKSIGNTSAEGIVATSKMTVENNFSSSLFSEKVLVDDIEYEVIPTHGSKSEDKKLLFRPDTKIDIGSVVQMDENVYLIVDFLGNGIYEVYPTATLKICNSTFPIESDKTKVLIGYDKYNRPKFEEKATITQVPCIVETKYYFNNRNEQITLPEDRVMISLKYQEAPNIVENYQFDLYKSSFRITFVDYSKVINGKGIMQITGERVVNKDGNV